MVVTRDTTQTRKRRPKTNNDRLCFCRIVRTYTYALNKLVGVVRKTNIGTNTVYKHTNIYTFIY